MKKCPLERDSIPQTREQRVKHKTQKAKSLKADCCDVITSKLLKQSPSRTNSSRPTPHIVISCTSCFTIRLPHFDRHWSQIRRPNNQITKSTRDPNNQSQERNIKSYWNRHKQLQIGLRVGRGTSAFASRAVWNSFPSQLDSRLQIKNTPPPALLNEIVEKLWTPNIFTSART